MVVTSRARVHEEAPPERATATYALRRAVRTGVLYARVRLAGLGWAGRLGFGLDAAAKTAAGAVVALALLPFGRPRAFRLLLRVANNLGKLRGFGSAPPPSAWDRPTPTPSAPDTPERRASERPA